LKILPNTTPSAEIISVARLESGFQVFKEGMVQKKPQEANKTEGYYPSLKKNLPKCSSIILKIFIAVVPIVIFFSSHKLY
jgi:hypothetical protein